MYDYYSVAERKTSSAVFLPFYLLVKMQTIGKFFKEAKRQDESLYTVFSKTMYIQRHILLQKPRPNTELKDITD